MHDVDDAHSSKAETSNNVIRQTKENASADIHQRRDALRNGPVGR
jgi:hypothetical protein